MKKQTLLLLVPEKEKQGFLRHVKHRAPGLRNANVGFSPHWLRHCSCWCSNGDADARAREVRAWLASSHGRGASLSHSVTGGVARVASRRLTRDASE